MTDKEIIDDGFDVSECEFLWKEKLPKRFCNNGNLDCDCNSNPNCYFKQLKAKEQEYEELNKQVELLNEKLSRKRAVIKLADCPNYSYGDNTLEPTCTKNFCYDIKSCDHKDMVKYKQALDEIEDFLNGACNACKEFTPNKQSYIGCRYCQSTQILDIINKVKEEINEES